MLVQAFLYIKVNEGKVSAFMTALCIDNSSNIDGVITNLVIYLQ